MTKESPLVVEVVAATCPPCGGTFNTASLRVHWYARPTCGNAISIADAERVIREAWERAAR